MRTKPTIEVMPQRALTVPSRGSAVMVATPPQMVAVPVPMTTPRTTWGAKRQARYYDALRDSANAQSGYLRAWGEVAKSFVAATRAANEVGELPEICESDTQIRRLHRERDYINALREREESRWGLYAAQDEVDKLRRPRVKKALRNGVAIEALMKSKIDMEALGEDTTELDRTLVALQQD